MTRYTHGKKKKKNLDLELTLITKLTQNGSQTWQRNTKQNTIHERNNWKTNLLKYKTDLQRQYQENKIASID